MNVAAMADITCTVNVTCGYLDSLMVSMLSGEFTGIQMIYLRRHFLTFLAMCPVGPARQPIPTRFLAPIGCSKISDWVDNIGFSGYLMVPDTT
jgi:hypothetical protein